MRIKTALAFIPAVVLFFAWLPGCGEFNAVEYTENLPPVISSLIAESTAATVGEEIRIRLFATDPDDSNLTYIWDSTGGDLNYDGSLAVFVGNEDREYVVRALVTDGKSRVFQDIRLRYAQFFDGFDDYETGAPPPAPWSWDSGVFGAVQVTPYVQYGESGNSLEIIDAGAQDEPWAMVDLSPPGGASEPQASEPDLVIRFYVMVDGSGFDVFGWDRSKVEYATLVWGLRFFSDRIYAWDPTQGEQQLREVGSYSSGRTVWHEITAYLSFELQQWLVSVDGDIVDQAIGMYGRDVDQDSECTLVEFRGLNSNEGGSLFIDSVIATADAGL